VVGAVFDALFGRWSLDSATIGEDVLPSAIEAVVQAVSGVEGSRVSALARTGEPRDERRQISASPAHYDDKTKSIVAAEILVINPNSAVTAPTLPPSTFVKGGVTLVLSGGQPGAGS
jgi:hypothetical protein